MKSTVSLKRFLLMHFSLVAIVPVIIIVVLMWLVIIPAIGARTSIKHEAMARSIADRISAHMRNGQRQLTALAEYLKDGEEFYLEQRISFLLDTQCGRGEFFEAIFIVGNSDNTIKSVGLPVSRRAMRADLTGLDLSCRPFITTAKDTQKILWSAPFLSTVSRQVVIALSVPLSDSLIIGEITLDNLSGFINDLPVDAGFITLVMDDQERVVGDSSKLRLGQKLNLNNLLSNGTDREKYFSSGTFELDGVQFLGTLVGVEESGWKIMVAQPASKAFELLRYIYVIMVLGLSIAIGIAVVISWFQAGKLTDPFRKYTKKAQSIASGRYDLQWPRIRIKEYQQLAQSLQHMAVEISQREKALVESEERLKDLISNVPGVVYQYSPSLNAFTSVVKEKAIELLGLDSEPDQLFDDFVARLPEEDQSRFLESVDEAIDNIKPWHYEGRFIKPSGKEIWFESHSMPRKVGERIVFYGILIDASLRKQLEEDLRLTRSIFDKAPIGIWRMGETGEVLDVNEKGRSSLGYVIEELCGMMVFDFTLGFDKEDWETGTENLKKYGVNNIAEVYLRHKNGEIIPVQVIENLVRFEDQAFRIAFALDISERQRMEQALKESEERLDLALSSANEGIWDWHIQEEKVFFDSRYYTMAGYEPNEFPGSFNEWEKRVHKDDLERARSDISRYLAGDIEKFDTEFRFVRKDGSFMWIQAKGKIVSRDDRNNPVRFIGTHADISDRKLSEIALNKTLTNLSNSQKLAKVGSFEWDVIKGEVEWSDEVYRIFGRNRDNFKPKIDSIMNQLHPDDRKLHETLIEQALSNREKYSFETRIIMPDDDTRFLAAVSEGHYDENGNVIGITGTVQDITDRKHAESALLKSEERLRLALDGTADGIWDYDPRTGQAYFSPRYYTMMGYEPGEFLPTYDNWRKLVHPDDVKEAEESINRALEKNASFAIEFRFRTRNGDWRWILGRGKVVDVDPEGKAARVAGSHTDITDRKRMAEALEKRIVALTQPLEDAESIAFEDLFNLSDIQHLQDLYAEAFGVAALITHPDGTPITEQSNFTVLCGEIIRKTPKGIKNCNYSDAMVGKHNPAGPNIQPCLSAGLCNAGASITVGGRHIANWLIGQVRDEAQKEEEIMAYAREIGADEAAFRAAYHQVPTMSEEQFEKAAKVLFTVTKQLSMSAYQNIQQARFITQRKRAEQALRENEQLLVNIVESMNEGVVMLDREFNYKLFNNYMEELSDTPRQKVFGKKPWEAFPDIKKTGIFDNFKKAMKGERIVDKEIHFTFPHKKDEWLKDSFIPLKDTDGSIIGVLHIAIDITRQKQDEEELRRLRNYLSNIIDSMPSILVAVDKDGKVTQWNNQSERITGLSFEDVRAQPLVKVFPRLAEEIDHIRDSIRESRVIKNSKIERNEDKEARFEDVTIFPLVTNGVEGAVIRVDDITEQVRLEEMMIQSEKMLSVGGLAAGMAHEINNPLAGMMQTAEVMANRLKGNINIPANRKAAEAAGTTIETIEGFMEARGIPRMLDVITDSGKRIATIVNNMLSFARKSEATFSFHILEDLLDKTAELAATDYDLKKQYDFKKIDIRREYAGNLPQVPCDGAKIQQVLLNILRNGAQAMQAAGIESPCFIFRTRFNPDKDMVIIEIEDNGPGMDDETRKRVFEPFFTTKPVGVGTGLGLSVSYFIITENHGGEMAVEASSGTGAKFIIRLPVKGK